MSAVAPRTGDQAAAFLREQHTSTRSWRGLCLSLQRQARGLPAVYPSALSAANATPTSERVAKVGDLERGMVGYCDDPHDSSPYGHIFFVAGWDGPRDDPDNCLTWTNDAKRPGGVDLVPLSFYKPHWGDTFMFGATWLNGYDFADFDAPPKPTPGFATQVDALDHAIADVRRALHDLRARKGQTRRINALARDLDRLKTTRARFPKA